MNSSDNPGPGNDGIQPWIDPDLEARIVAAVVGEASDFEMAELDRMLEAKPELAVFKRRIEAVHGLVGESYAPAPKVVHDDDQWRLAPERRERLLATLGLKPAGDAEAEESIAVAGVGATRKTATWKIWASCVAAALVAVCAVLLSLVQSRSSVVQGRFLAVSEEAAVKSAMPMEPESAMAGMTDEWAYSAAPPSARPEAPAAPVDAAGSSGRYRETLKQLANATGLGDTEALIAQTERPTLQAGSRQSGEEIRSLNIRDYDNDSEDPPATQRESKLAEMEQLQELGGVGVAQSLGGGQWGATSGQQPARGSIPELLVAQNDKNVDAFGRSAEPQSNGEADTRDYFFERSEPELEKRSAVTGSGQEAIVELTRDFINPTEYGVSEIADADTKEIAGKLDLTRDAISEPFSTSGKLNLNYEVLRSGGIKRAEGTVDLFAAEAAPAGKPDGYSINLAAAPEVVEFEGFVNNREMVKGPELQEEVEKSDVVWDTPQVEGGGPSIVSLGADNDLEANRVISLGESSKSSGRAASIHHLYADGTAAAAAAVDGEDARASGRTQSAPPAPAPVTAPLSGIVAGAEVAEATQGVAQLEKKLELEKQVMDENDPVVAFEGGAVVEDLARAENEAVADAALFGTIVDGGRERRWNGVAEVMPPAEPAQAGDLNITLREKNTGALSFAGLSSIDNLKGFRDIPQTNFDVAGLGTDANGDVPGEGIAGVSADFKEERLAESLLVDEGRGLERQRRTSTISDFDIGVGNAPDSSLLQLEADVRFQKKEPVLEEASGEVAEDRVELAKAKAGNGEYDDARAILNKRELAVAESKQPDVEMAQDEKMDEAKLGELEEEEAELAEAERLLNEFRTASVRKRIDLTLPKSAMSIEPHSSDNDNLNDAALEQLDALTADERRLEQRVEDAAQKLIKIQERLEREAEWKESGKEFAPVTTTEELAATNAFSTFSLNVSDVAFKLAQSALMKGEWPEPEKMRVEEFVNALDYGDPAPAAGEKVTCRTEQCAHPFMQQRNLLRIAMRTAAVGREGGQPLRLTILLDNSGSMQREDREASVRRAMEVLAGQLQPNDQVSLIGFARTPRLLADRVSGSDGGKLLAAVDDAPSEGGTNLEEAMRLAAEVAQRQYDDGAVNRIVLMTDGAANLGNADPEELATRVVELRQKGIAFDACGVGAKGLNDEVLEALTRKGDGRYYFLDAPEQADSGFASQLAGALRPAAKNVKVQVVFNPERVGAYRLIGYEKHRLKKEDFRNDAVDAAEMAAEETGVAVYQIEPMADGSGDVGEVHVRFQDVASGRMIEHHWIIPYEANAPTIEGAKPSIQLAGVAAMLGEYLRGGPEASNVDLDVLSSLAPGLRSAYGDNVRVNQLIGMIRDAQMAK